MNGSGHIRRKSRSAIVLKGFWRWLKPFNLNEMHNTRDSACESSIRGVKFGRSYPPSKNEALSNF